MRKWFLVIDVAKCSDCNNCFLSCKDEHFDNDWPGYSLSQPRHGHRWINIMRKERGHGTLMDVAYLPVPCMHCDNAPCMKKAEDGAVYKRDDGIVIIDPDKSKGMRGLVSACPYGAIWWNEEKNVPQKCGFCAHLLDGGWKEPRCVQACPGEALRSFHLEDSEMQQIVARENLGVLNPEYKTKPRVYYKNLYRFFKCFIAGSVAIEADGVTDCAENAKVTLFKDSSRRVDEAVTDNYGDFKFDHLEENSGNYRIEIAYPNFEIKKIEVDLKESVYLGDVYL